MYSTERYAQSERWSVSFGAVGGAGGENKTEENFLQSTCLS